MLVQRAPATTRQRVRVLVVDDNTGFRDSLVSLLDTDELMVVGQAGNGAQALELFVTTKPNVVLMDVRMPTMDGIETTRRLKAMDPSIGIVALTGLEDQRAVRDMLVAGASGYVLKDSDGDEILNAVREAASGGGIISPAAHADRDRGADRGARTRAPAHPAVGDRARGAAGARGEPPRAGLTPGSRAAHAGDRDPGHGPDARGRDRARGGPRASCWTDWSRGRRTSPGSCSGSRRRSRPASPSGPT